MTAMDPVIPSGPSSAWIALGVIWAVAVGILAFVLWSLCRPEPAGTPPAEQAPTDGVDEHAETAAALTIPNLDPRLPTRVDPDDDIDGVEIDVPFVPDERDVFAAIIGPLGADRTYRRRVENLERQMSTKEST